MSINFNINVILDKNISKEPVYIVSNQYKVKDYYDITVYTGPDGIVDFNTTTCICSDEEVFSSYSDIPYEEKKKLIKNVKVRLKNKDGELNTREENEMIMEFLNKNPLLMQESIYVDAGYIAFNKDNMERVEPFIDNSKILVDYENIPEIHPVVGISSIGMISSYVTCKVEKHPEFSPIEKALYAYDIIRTNCAQDEKNDINYLFDKTAEFYSEELSTFYATIFYEVLKNLGITAKRSLGEFDYAEEKGFVIAYIKDDKYDLDGIYYFDPTIESKIEIESNFKTVNNYLKTEKDEKDKLKIDPVQAVLKRYICFGKTKQEFEENACLALDYHFGDFGEDYFDLISEMIDNGEDIGKRIDSDSSTLNSISMFVTGSPFLTEKDIKKIDTDEELRDELLNVLEYMSKMFSNNINAEDFVKILFNVRKAEYLENPNTFPLKTDDLKQIVMNAEFKFYDFDPDEMYGDIEEECMGIDDEEVDEIYAELNDTIKEELEGRLEECFKENEIDSKVKKLQLLIDNKKNKKDNE